MSDADMLESRAMLPKAGDVIGEPCDVSSSEEDKAEGWTWKGGGGGVEEEATICNRSPRER